MFNKIVGISTDKLKDKSNWQEVIRKHKLPWLQYPDQNGAASQKISIVAFPTNFLFDRRGKVIKKNLSPVELENFLKQYL